MEPRAVPTIPSFQGSSVGVKAVASPSSEPAWFNGEELKKGSVIIVGLPGAYTPVCSSSHVPGYLAKAAELQAAGINRIYVLSSNDAFVMKNWAAGMEEKSWEGKVVFLADGNGWLIQQLGVEKDMADKGMGKRSRRCALWYKDGKLVSSFFEKNPDDLVVSKAEHVLEEVKGGGGAGSGGGGGVGKEARGEGVSAGQVAGEGTAAAAFREEAEAAGGGGGKGGGQRGSSGGQAVIKGGP